MHKIQRRSPLLVSRSHLRQLTAAGSLACALAGCAEEAPPPPFGSNSPNATVTPTPVTPTASPTIATNPPGSVPSPNPSQAPQPTAQPTAPEPAGTPTTPQGPAAMPPMPGTPTAAPPPTQPEQPAVPTAPAEPTTPAPAPAAGVTCDAAWSVGSNGYVRAPGAGGSCWAGYAYAFAEGAGSSISPADFETCGEGCTLCVTGTVAATADYSGVAAVGFNLSQGASGGTESTTTPGAGAIGINVTNRGGSDLRVQLNGASEWCADISGQTGAVSLTHASFKTECWGETGTAYAGQAIKALMLLIPGSNEDDVEFDVCLNGVTPP